MSRARRLRALAVVLALVACDETWDLDVYVRVAPAVTVTPASAFQVFVAFDDGGGGFVAFLVGYACGTDPYGATSRFWAPTGATPPGAVVGWLVPVDPALVPACGPLPAPRPISPAPVPPPSRATTVVGTPVVGCGGSAREASLELDAP